MTVSTTLDDPF